MRRMTWTILTLIVALSFLTACAAPPAAPAPTQAPAAAEPTKAPEAPKAPEPTQAPAAPEDPTTKQADTTNLFPNGIGQVDCKGVNLVVATQTGPQIASPVENNWKLWGEKTGGTVEVQTFPFGDLFPKIRTGYLSGSSPFDIIIYASDWAGDIMGPGYVLEIPQKNQDQMGYAYLIPSVPRPHPAMGRQDLCGAVRRRLPHDLLPGRSAQQRRASGGFQGAVRLRHACAAQDLEAIPRHRDLLQWQDG